MPTTSSLARRCALVPAILMLAALMPACDRRDAAATPPPDAAPVASDTAAPSPAPSPAPEEPAARAPAPTIAASPIRGLWVTRWDYITPADVLEIITNTADAGFTDVFWQVRGQADAFYRSSLEPWGEELARDPETLKLPDGIDLATFDPGFDPLVLAIDEAHARGLRLHAWLNVMPLWRLKVPPRNPLHPWHTHPEWRLIDQAGQTQSLNDHYVIVNPMLDGVHDHIVAVAADLVTRYQIDGLHLDYVRFVSDRMEAGKFYPADAAARDALEQATGSRELATPEQQAAMRQLVRDRITLLVQRLRSEAVDRRPGVQFTAAVWRRPELAFEQNMQDAARWLNAGTLDAAIPMIYTTDDARFTDDLAAWRAAAPNARVLPGIGMYLHPDGDRTAAQTNLARGTAPPGSDEFVLFAYASLFRSRTADQDKTSVGDAERAARLAPVRATLRPDSSQAITPPDQTP